MSMNEGGVVTPELNQILELLTPESVTWDLENVIASNLHPILRKPCLHLIKAGGKRVRAIIPPLVCGACGGDPLEARQAGLILELVHTFTLIHDDIMDEATERRGVEPVHVAYGLPTAINAGNALFALAVAYGRGKRDWFIDDTITRAAMELAAGQQMDLKFRGQEILHELYHEIILKKTAPLFEAGAHIGAMCAGADTDSVIDMSTWGKEFGMSFQARDDVLDNFSIAGDVDLQQVAEAHRTVALQHLECLEDSYWKSMLIMITNRQIHREV